MMSIRLLNVFSVGVLGMVLSAAFCDIFWTKKKIFAMAGGVVGILLFQGIIYSVTDLNIVKKLYPLITHIPLTVMLCILNRKCVWPTISVLSAYLCCQIRRWLALLIVFIFSGTPQMQDVVELAMTLPIIALLIWLVAPAVRAMSHFPISIQCLFGLIPALYYGFDYLTQVYTDLLLQGVLAVAEFMSFVCSVAYLIFVTYISKEQQTRSKLEQNQAILNLQIEQAVREIAALRESQEKTGIYRHDMRHHMQYLSSCIENGQLKQAKGYIRKIYTETEANTVRVYCENEAANLIFSAFARRAEDSGVPMRIRAQIPQVISVPEIDLCVLLSNALENALLASGKQREKGKEGVIEVFVYEKKGKLFLEISNPCGEDITFDKGIPVTNRSGHGFGVRSICAVVERYGGICSFSVQDGKFILSISI